MFKNQEYDCSDSYLTWQKISSIVVLKLAGSMLLVFTKFKVFECHTYFFCCIEYLKT